MQLKLKLFDSSSLFIIGICDIFAGNTSRFFMISQGILLLLISVLSYEKNKDKLDGDH